MRRNNPMNPTLVENLNRIREMCGSIVKSKKKRNVDYDDDDGPETELEQVRKDTAYSSETTSEWDSPVRSLSVFKRNFTMYSVDSLDCTHCKTLSPRDTSHSRHTTDECESLQRSLSMLKVACGNSSFTAFLERPWSKRETERYIVTEVVFNKSKKSKVFVCWLETDPKFKEKSRGKIRHYPDMFVVNRCVDVGYEDFEGPISTSMECLGYICEAIHSVRECILETCIKVDASAATKIMRSIYVNSRYRNDNQSDYSRASDLSDL